MSSPYATPFGGSDHERRFAIDMPKASGRSRQPDRKIPNPEMTKHSHGYKAAPSRYGRACAIVGGRRGGFPLLATHKRATRLCARSCPGTFTRAARLVRPTSRAGTTRYPPAIHEGAPPVSKLPPYVRGEKMNFQGVKSFVAAYRVNSTFATKLQLP